jgi:RNA polymerase sigma-70 factor (ECF subfamily)
MLDPVSLAADLEAVAAGDEAALRRLWDAAAPTLFSLSLRLTGRRTAAEDALQESFVRIWRKAHRYDRALGDPLGWMAAVTRNVALDQLRRPHARREVTLEDGGPRAEVATQVDLGLADADLRRCLECLPDMQRSAILLAYYRGLTHIEIAAALGAPLGTVKSWIKRGLNELKNCLER